MLIDKEIAKRSASHKFGDVFFWWYAFPVIAAKVFKALCFLALATGAVFLAAYVYTHAELWLHWLNGAITTYLIPSLFVALGVVMYTVGAILVWRMWGWLLKFKGLTTKMYTVSACAILIGFMSLMGVVL